MRAVKHSSALRAALVVELKHSEADADMHKHKNMRHALVRCEMSDLVQLLKKSLEDPSLRTSTKTCRALRDAYKHCNALEARLPRSL